MWEPFASLNRIESHINEMFGNGATRPWVQAGHGSWRPAVDVLESKDAYLIRAELPGMKKEDFNLEVKEGILTLTGERNAEKLAEGVQYRSVERVSGKFVRSFSLPKTVNHDAIEAAYKDGVLEVRVPKAEEAKPRQITVH
jgi:HSP20 family protein